MKIIEIKKWMKKGLIKISKASTIVNAAKLMAKNNAGSLVVVNNNKPIGIITTTDILRRVVAKGVDPKNTSVDKIMTKKLITADHRITFKQLATKMRQHKIKHIVITENKKLIGMITSTDIIKLHSGTR